MKNLFISLLLFFFSNALFCQVVEGIDVSGFQGTINWTSVYNDNITFAYIKATEGATYTSPAFYTNVVNGENAGVVVGAYHFARPNNNTAVQEANNFISTSSGYIGNGYLPPALDIEDYDDGGTTIVLSNVFTPSQLANWITTWAQTVQSQTGVAPVIYMNQNYASWISSSVNTYGLWIADWDNSPTSGSNTGVWSTRTFKQYTDAGSVAGISGNVDRNSFNGTMTDFNNLIGSGSSGPSNDNCNGAIALQSNTNCIYTSGSVDNATPDNSWNDATCDQYTGTPLAADVFYQFNAVNTSHTITVDPTGDLDAVVSLYSGSSCFNLNEIDCADNGGGNGQTEVINATNLTPGQTYWVRIYDYGVIMPSNGGFDICVTHSSPGPIDVACGGIIIDDDNSGSSSGDGDGVWEPTEGIEVDLELINTGSVTLTNLEAIASTSSSYVTINDPDISNYNDLNPGDSDYGNDFDFELASNCPLGTVITFDITITCDQGTFYCSFTITTAIDPVPCTYTLNPSSQTYSYPAQQGSFNVSTDPGCAWTATTSCSFANLTTTSGTGSGTVNFNLLENTTGASRSCTIVVNGTETFTITQDPDVTTLPCSDSFSTSNMMLSSSSQGTYLNLSTDVGCDWTAVSSDYSWLTFTNNSGTGNGIVTFEITENTSPSMRGLEITTPNGAICVVQQEAMDTANIIETANIELGVRIYPNPTDGQISIDYPSDFTAQTVYLTNSLGEVVQERSTNLKQLDMSDCASGIYILIIADDNNRRYSYRVVKN